MIQSGRNTTVLFNECTFDKLASGHLERMKKQMEDIDQDQLLGRSLDDWCDFFGREYHIDPISLNTDNIQVDHNEADVDVRFDFQRDIEDKSKPFYIKGLEVCYFIPYIGDSNLFKITPSTRYYNLPKGLVKGDHVILKYAVVDHASDALQRQAQADIDNLKSYVTALSDDIERFNSQLRQKVHDFLNYRKEKLLKDKDLVESLGYPLKKRGGAPLTYPVPQARKHLRQPMPKAPQSPFAPEPTLTEDDYNEILQIIGNMALVLEQSPQVFKHMGEEFIRTLFIVHLNGLYQGSATAETFNFEGKTDILIREKGHNIFIAECKFWAGPKSLCDTIDQLLGYVTWRDTKTAIIIFNRNKDFSSVLAKIPEVVRSHPNCKREMRGKTESSFRYTMRHRDDENREFTLTILAFEVPG